MKNIKSILLFTLFTIALSLLIFACQDQSSNDPVISSRSYSGHESDADANNLVRANPNIVGTRIDNCQTCHTGGTITYDDAGSPGKTKDIDNPCSYCHIRVFEDSEDYYSGYPSSYEDTLNNYGLAYKNAGRSISAVKSIADLDSDSDGFLNDQEIDLLRYPGDLNSYPGQPLAPTIELDWDEVMAMTSTTQFMLMNATKQQYDEYVTYTGVQVTTLLTSAGVDLTGATGITFIAPDGYQTSLDLTDDINYAYGVGGTFSLLDQGILWPVDPNRHFISYPDDILGLSDGDAMPDNLYPIIAYQRNGLNLDLSYYDETDGRINGEGPYRIIRPQKQGVRATTNGYGPDRGSRSTAYTDDWDYAEDLDHNAGDCVKGTCVIRIDPMPAGYEEYTWQNGWSLISDKLIIIYGHGVPTK